MHNRVALCSVYINCAKGSIQQVDNNSKLEPFSVKKCTANCKETCAFSNEKHLYDYMQIIVFFFLSLQQSACFFEWLPSICTLSSSEIVFKHPAHIYKRTSVFSLTQVCASRIKVEQKRETMSGSCSTTDVVYRQRILQEQDRNRIAHALLMQRAMSTMELRDTRPPPKVWT